MVLAALHGVLAAAAPKPTPPIPNTDLIVFWIFAPIAVCAAIGMVLSRNAVHSALFLIVNFFCLAVFFLVLGSPFLFAVQIIVYAGAIMVLFLFVIMLLGVDSRESMVERLKAQRSIAVLLAIGLIAELFSAIRLGVGLSTTAKAGFDVTVNRGSNIRALADVLFNGYFFPFEATSILLIVAAVAAMVIAGRRSALNPPAPAAPAAAEAPPGEAPEPSEPSEPNEPSGRTPEPEPVS
ncbi:MAG TPA: NADH-quinone oxidoreductase subunit J [Actinomycetota bacterium]|nr:NADH-quinone oxidoreductase subunit J [Actinomycetota bacterium]